MKKKILLASIVALSLALLVAVGGTIAWLYVESNEVENIFTPSDINISLTESDDLDFKMIPGNTIEKDPTVTVTTDLTNPWLFVVVEESANLTNYISYAMAAGWTPLGNAYPGVYFYNGTVVSGTPYPIINGSVVTVNTSVTKGMMNAIDGIDDNGLTNSEAALAEIAARPTLNFVAYAVQRENVDTAEAAWSVAITGDIPVTNP